MINVGICDDSRKTVFKLKCIIEKHLTFQSVEHIVYYYTSGITLLASNIEFDIVFLDIEMNQINGIETAKKLRERSLNTKIIYVTSYQKYQPYAFQVHAFEYIMKPFDEDVVCGVLDEALKYIEEKEKKDSFSFYSDKGLITIKVPDVFYLEFQERKIHIISKSATYYMNGTLSKIYEELKHYSFGMPHKSYIVNFIHINSIKGYDINMKNGDIVPIAQRKAVKFKEEFYEFLHETYYLLR